MDSWLTRARTFAEETAKRSQEIVNQTAKYSEQFAKDAAKKSREFAEEAAKRSKEVATETARRSQVIAEEAAKRSRVIAEEAAKKADVGYRSLLKEFQASSFSGNGSSPASVNGKNVTVGENELQEYGITDDFREFVKGLTLKTFKDFPTESLQKDNVELRLASEEAAEPLSPTQPQLSLDLTAWQEHHARLVLQVVPEISNFRYVLCPREMKEAKFWKIYFLVVKSHIDQYEHRSSEKAAELNTAIAKSEEKEDNLVSVSSKHDDTSHSSVEAKELSKSVDKVDNEQDLDEYLLGALDTGDEDDDVDFDADDFDQFVNSSPNSPHTTDGSVNISEGPSLKSS